MTCIVGIEHKGGVIIGGDSAGVAGWGLSIRADTKVFRNRGYVMGFTTSFRMGQILRYATLPKPAPNVRDLDRFMATTFVDGVRKALEAGGWLSKEHNREEGGTFLVGVCGKLYGVESDFQIARTLNGYTACGAGEDIALGSLHTTAQFTAGPRQRVELALAAAADHSAGVAGPFVVEELAP